MPCQDWRQPQHWRYSGHPYFVDQDLSLNLKLAVSARLSGLWVICLSHPPVLGLQMVKGCHVGAGTLRSFGRVATGLNLWPISIPQEIFNLCFACYACSVGDRNRGQEYSRQALYGGITPPAHVFPTETETVIPTCSLSYLKRDKLGD